MTTRLKNITTALVVCASFAAAGTASAAQDNPGATTRCEAAQNGQHNGFTCGPVDDSNGVCARGYNRVPTSGDATGLDTNSNGWVCTRS